MREFTLFVFRPHRLASWLLVILKSLTKHLSSPLDRLIHSLSIILELYAMFWKNVAGRQPETDVMNRKAVLLEFHMTGELEGFYWILK